MRLPKTITARWLKRIGACDLGIEEFKRVFPEGFPLDPKKITARRIGRLSYLRVSQIGWLIERLLSGRPEEEDFLNEESVTYGDNYAVFYARWLRKAIRLNQVKGKG